MPQIQKAEGQAQIRCDADKFFDAWARKPYTISKMCPSKVPNLELIEGAWDVAGAKYIWTFLLECNCNHNSGKDEKNRTLYYDLIGGQMVQDYKSYRDNIQVIPAGEGSIVKWSVEYEKMREDVPDADIYIDFLLDCAKEMDAQLCAA